MYRVAKLVLSVFVLHTDGTDIILDTLFSVFKDLLWGVHMYIYGICPFLLVYILLYRL